MDTGFADHVMDEGEVVDDWAEGGDWFAEHFAGLAVGFEVPDRAEPWAETVLEGFDWFAEVARLAVASDEFGFEVEQVEVAGGPGHEELDDAFGARGVLREGEGWGVFAGEERCQGDAREGLEEGAAGEVHGRRAAVSRRS
jgi:hypothetical protein